MTLEVKHWEGVIKRVKERYDARAEAMKEWTKQLPPGASRPNQEEFMAGIAMKLDEFPAEPWIMPNGMPVEVSPWIAHLQYLKGDNAKNAMRRLQKYLNEEAGDGAD